eukprot:2045761-Rhodomonas_salina.1
MVSLYVRAPVAGERSKATTLWECRHAAYTRVPSAVATNCLGPCIIFDRSSSVTDDRYCSAPDVAFLVKVWTALSCDAARYTFIPSGLITMSRTPRTGDP